MTTQEKYTITYPKTKKVVREFPAVFVVIAVIFTVGLYITLK